VSAPARRVVPDEPPPGTRYKRHLTPTVALRDLWASRTLLRALSEREYRSRYHQTRLGMLWAVITPVLLMVVFTAFIQRVADVDTGDVPYPVFAYLGLLPWSFFSTSCSRGASTLVLESSLVNKVRCPREVFPLATISTAFVDMLISAGVLAVIMAVTTTAPKPTIVWVPFILLVQVVATVGIVLLLAITIVYLRDLGQALPLVLQLGLFATPVAYGAATLVERTGTWYAALNPLVGVIESYRACVVGGTAPPWDLMLPSTIGAVVWLLVGSYVFKRYEVGIADVA
jgi:ABC-2 type transport system permease protein/lipopolysaccharide transport system permease protein